MLLSQISGYGRTAEGERPARAADKVTVKVGDKSGPAVLKTQPDESPYSRQMAIYFHLGSIELDLTEEELAKVDKLEFEVYQGDKLVFTPTQLMSHGWFNGAGD